MWNAVVNLWREVRAQQLRKEFDDWYVRMQNVSPDFHLRTVRQIGSMYHGLESQLGSLDDVSVAGRRKIARQLMRRARSMLAVDQSCGYGWALLAMWLESQSLPGNDAGYVRTMSEQLVRAALEVCRRAEDS